MEGGTFTIKGQGKVTKEIEVNRTKVNLEFNNALHTPDLTSNLISIACLCDTGYQVLFSAEEAIVFNNKGAFTCKQGPDRMYTLGNSKLVDQIPKTPVKAYEGHRYYDLALSIRTH